MPGHVVCYSRDRRVVLIVSWEKRGERPGSFVHCKRRGCVRKRGSRLAGTKYQNSNISSTITSISSNSNNNNNDDDDDDNDDDDDEDDDNDNVEKKKEAQAANI